jgi:hypothetical protein
MANIKIEKEKDLGVLIEKDLWSPDRERPLES